MGNLGFQYLLLLEFLLICSNFGKLLKNECFKLSRDFQGENEVEKGGGVGDLFFQNTQYTLTKASHVLYM